MHVRIETILFEIISMEFNINIKIVKGTPRLFGNRP